MTFIKNDATLATTKERTTILQLIETGLDAIQPQKVLEKNISLHESLLTINNKSFDLKNYKRVFLIGFGKGSGALSKILEKTLGAYLTDGYVIDNVVNSFSKLHFTLGSHPLPSQENITFTETVLKNIHDLTQDDLVLVVICGGGSAMFESPHAVDLATLTTIFHTLLTSGATITEMNAIRKHLSKVKGGNLAKHLYPATVASLIFSDVPGSDLATIASGPTVRDTTTMDDVSYILKQYHLTDALPIPENAFAELPQDDIYFEHVHNFLILSNSTALNAMKEKAEQLGYTAHIYSDRVQGDAKTIGKELLEATQPNSILLAGGETTIKVKGNGKGGRNQTLVLAALPFIDHHTTFASFDSDGIDFYHFAGAIADTQTNEHATKIHLDAKEYLDNDNSYAFWEKIADGIYTDKLDSNVSDLMIVIKS